MIAATRRSDIQRVDSRQPADHAGPPARPAWPLPVPFKSHEMSATDQRGQERPRRARPTGTAGKTAYVIRLASPKDGHVEGIWGATTVLCLDGLSRE